MLYYYHAFRTALNFMSLQLAPKSGNSSAWFLRASNPINFNPRIIFDKDGLEKFLQTPMHPKSP